jgi:predicted Zn-dependent protease
MVIGTVQLHLRDFARAQNEFAAANHAYEKRNGRQSHVALDSIGYAFFESRWHGPKSPDPARAVNDRLMKAEEHFKKALAVNPQYDSALYHMAQIYDEKSRIVFRNLDSVDTCEVLQYFNEAASGYEKLLRDHPNYAIAYEQFGTMLLQRYYFLRKNESSRCASELPPKTEAVEEIFRKALELFDNALALDPKLGQAWLQSGILFYQAQDPKLKLSSVDATTSKESRRALLDDAVVRLANASEISPDNWYIWQRLAEVNHARGCVSDRPDKQAYAKRARRAYCRAADAIERDRNAAWRAGAGQAELGNLSRMAMCLSEPRSDCSVPDPAPPEAFCDCQ